MTLLFFRAHWYLAVICFPGLEAPAMEPDSTRSEDSPAEENIPDHCRPLSPDRDMLEGFPEDPSPVTFETPADSDPPKENAAMADRRPADREQQYTSEF